MPRYVMLECKDCGTRKIYPARTFDGKLCPKCNGRLFLPIRFLNHKKETEEKALNRAGKPALEFSGGIA